MASVVPEVSDKNVQDFLHKSAHCIVIRMRGLPYKCTPQHIIHFFKDGSYSSTVLDATEGILLVKRPDGKATGDAFVLFESKGEADKALSKHKQMIGSRYIELFLTTPGEVYRHLHKTMEVTAIQTNQGLHARDCIHIRGLDTSTDAILEMLGQFAGNVLVQGIHEVYDSQGQPLDEAFIQMDSEGSAFQAAQLILQNQIILKKQLHVNVVPRSVLLNGLQAHTKQAASPLQGPQLPPHMLYASHNDITHMIRSTQNNCVDPPPNGSLPLTRPTFNPLVKFLPPGMLPPYQNLFHPMTTQGLSQLDPLLSSYFPQALTPSAAPRIPENLPTFLAQPSPTLPQVSLSSTTNTHHLQNPMTAQPPIFFFNSPSIQMTQHQSYDFPRPQIYEHPLLLADPNVQLENIQHIHRLDGKRSWSQAFVGIHNDDFLAPKMKTPNSHQYHPAYLPLYSSPSPSTSMSSSTSTILNSEQML